MKIPRFFCRRIDTDSIVISDDQFRHIIRVLRLKNGNIAELFDGKGTVAQAVIEKITKNSATLKILTKESFDPPQEQRISIASSMAKNQRFEDIVARCTELGVDRLIPVIFERTVKQSGSLTAIKRFESIAVESAKQCGRIFLPVIDKPISFIKMMETMRKDSPQAKIIFGSPDKETKSVVDFDFAQKDCFVFIGPEGGLTADEEEMLKKVNAQPVRLTCTILRIETAAIAFAAILAAKRDYGK